MENMNIFKKIKRYFTPKEGRTFDMTRKGWGNAVHIEEDGVSVHGWLTPLPKKNDVVLFRMRSGRVGKYRFTEVKPCGDPSDMFFGKVAGVGYVNESE